VVQAGIVAREAADRQAEDLGRANYEAMRDALSRALQDTKNPVKAFAEGLANAVYTRLTARLADALATQLVGRDGNSGLLGGFFSALFGGGGSLGFGASGTGNLVGASTVGMSLARGGAFERGGQPVDRFAGGGAFTNQVVTRPTQFSYAGGRKRGEMGEAGAEGVFPLARTPDGKLGVHAIGGDGGDGVQVNVHIHGGPAEAPQVRTRRNGNQVDVDVLYGQFVSRLQADTANGGGLDPLMSGRYGLNPGTHGRA
jgi:phage-related minor tail protein